jgi:hypothetical protein
LSKMFETGNGGPVQLTSIRADVWPPGIIT